MIDFIASALLCWALLVLWALFLEAAITVVRKAPGPTMLLSLFFVLSLLVLLAYRC